MTKDEVIHKVYYDQAGYGSATNTWIDAKRKDPTITIRDVQHWFSKNIQQKKEPRGQNSFITPHVNFEYQVDLFFINDLPNQKFKIGMIMIGPFSKLMTVIPLSSKEEGDVMAGLLEGFHNMKHVPKMLYTDDEGALTAPAVKKYFQDKKIKHVVTRTHAPVAERGIRTFKDALYKRIDASKKDNIQWPDLIFEILITYNDKLKHSTTKMTPKEAGKDSNKLMVWVNNFTHSKQDRKYPDIVIGDKVKLLRKKQKGEKDRTSVWSKEVYKVEGVSDSLGQMFYKLETVAREYPRNALLKM